MYILRYIEPLVTLIVLILFLKRRKGEILWNYLLISFIADLTTITMRRVLHLPNYEMVSSIFLLTEFTIFLYYFYHWKIISKRIFFCFAIVCGGVYLIGLFDRHANYDSIFHSFMLIPQLSISLYAFYKLMRDSEYSSITNLSFFWGNTAIFIYTSCAFLLRLSHNFIEKNYSVDIQKTVYLVFLLFVAIKTILMGIALRKTKPNAD